MQPLPSERRERARFGDFELDVGTGELWRAGVPVALRPLAGRALVELVENAGHLVLRSDLRRILWPDVAVAWDQSLNQCVRQIRRALGDDATDPFFVETVPRRGYRFTGAVSWDVRVPAGGYAASRGSGSRAFMAFLAGAAAALTIPLAFLAICAAMGAG